MLWCYHPSFELGYEEMGSPGLALLEVHINAGFGELSHDVARTSQALGAEVHPAPLGLISKTREDGNVKHRLIQGQNRNLVNSAAQIPERQELPSHTDHAKDLALLSRSRSAEEKRQF